MSPKKSSHGKTKAARSGLKNARSNGLQFTPLPSEDVGSNGMRHEYQIIRNPYVPGAREKMLEKRNKLTLEAFQIAYENKHKRKSS